MTHPPTSAGRMRTVDELIADGVAGRRVLLRADLNVPLDDSTGTPVITDDGRIRASLPTLQALRDLGWDVLIVWECETKDAARLEARLIEYMRSMGA